MSTLRLMEGQNKIIFTNLKRSMKILVKTRPYILVLTGRFIYLFCGKIGWWEENSQKLSRGEHSFIICC